METLEGTTREVKIIGGLNCYGLKRATRRGLTTISAHHSFPSPGIIDQGLDYSYFIQRSPLCTR